VTNPIALSVVGEELYVAYLDQEMDKVLMVVSNKFEYQAHHEPLLISLSELPTDVKIFHPVLQMPGDNLSLLYFTIQFNKKGG